MTTNPFLVPATGNEDLTIPTIFAHIDADPRKDYFQEYVLPAPMIPLVEEGLQQLDQNEQPLIACCKVLHQWFMRHYPHGYLFCITHYARQRAIYIHGCLSEAGQEEISHLDITEVAPGMPDEPRVLHTIGVSGFAAFVLGRHGDIHLDELGDQFFGELPWQRLKQWLAQADEQA